MIAFTHVETPIGPLLAAADGPALVRVEFARDGRPADPDPSWERDDRALAAVVEEIRAYFDGRLRAFTVALSPEGTTFQRAVWSALTEIPYGETRTYSDIARVIGRPAAVRAVGAANGANPLPVVVPCHRVIGSSGSLTGFGGGLEVKRFLLDLEARVAGRRLF